MKRLLVFTGMIATLLAVHPQSSWAGTRYFASPTVGGDRLSFCTNDGTVCGKPIADAWCQAVGFEQALNFQRDRSRSNRPTVTRYADTGGLCRGKNCQAFRQIKCWSAAS